MVKNHKEILYDNEILTTERLILRKFVKNDAHAVYEYGSDPETLKYVSWNGVNTIDEATQNIIDYYWSKLGIFAIEWKKTKKCIGCIELRLEPEHEKASFAYILNRKYWGNGYMTEALSSVIKLCFEKLDLNRVDAIHFSGNEGSGKVMAKCGMKFEGIGRQEMKMKGIFRDVVHYGIIREDYCY